MQVQKIRHGFQLVNWYHNPKFEIPKDWNWTTLGKEGNLSSGATPRRDHPEYYEGTIPWVSSGELDHNVITDTLEHLSPLALEKTNLKKYPKDTFLFAITGLEAAGTRGRCAILGVDATTNQSCMAFYDSKSVDTRFLFYFYELYGEKIIFTLAQGTKQQSLNLHLSESIKLPLPSLPEQQKIDSIISNINSLIQKTDERISHYKFLKQGLMQQLLTKGISHTKFKKAKWFYGKKIEIPLEWEVSTLREACSKIQDMNHEMPKKIKNGIPFLSISHVVSKKEIDFSNTEYISEEDYSKFLKKIQPCVNDLLYSRVATIGEARLITYDGKFAFTYNVALMKTKSDISSLFLLYMLNSGLIKNRAISLAPSGVYSFLGLKDIRMIPILKPPFKEQQKIALILSSIDIKINEVEEKKSYLVTIKKGLMQNLLTGKIRVKVGISN